jgi:putative spermidine/putrescine transport system ATP-binding protein
MSYLVLEHLTKTFDDYTAVHDLTLGIERGEFISLLGPSGCGKTTTLQMIAGFHQPTAGSIRLDGKDLVAVSPNQRGLGIVFQSYALFPHMTAAENVGFGLEMQGVARDERRRLVGEMLDLVGLGTFSDRYPRKMSGGQQQRVALARALVIRPSILLLDEPLSNLDAKLREDMQIELRQIQRQLGTTTVLVTHDQAEAMALSDRIVVMNKGRIEQIGRPDESYERPKTAFVSNFLGHTNLLKGQASGGEVVIGDGRWAVPEISPGPVTVSVRPEKIAFGPLSANGLKAAVQARIFHGTHWLYHLDTAAGRAIVIQQNSGAASPTEGETLMLIWRSEHMIITPSQVDPR